ncbi:glycosyltransferase family 2 protein [Jannaschia rubra]|nr:glycosyltransferase family 2 protein [Jannaschia rubra]
MALPSLECGVQPMSGDGIKATVIVAAFRARDVLPASVQSALSQTGVTCEVVIVDDASGDGTFEAAKRLARDDDRVRVLRLERNGGPAAARNAALDVAQGEWIAVLDADDRMEPDRLARMIAFGEAQGADAVFDDFQPVDPAGQPIGTTHLAPLALQTPQLWGLERFLEGCQARPGVPSPGYLKPVLRRASVDRLGLRYDTTLRNGEDFHLIAALLASGGRLWVMPEAGYLYRRSAGTISARLDPQHARALAVADLAFARRLDLSDRARTLMRTRRRRLDDMAATEAVLTYLRARKPGAALSILRHRPSATTRLFRQVGEAIRRRISGDFRA